jgi:hypothetical protein
VADSPLCSVLAGVYFGDAIHRHVHSVLDTANPFPLLIPVRSGHLAEAEQRNSAVSFAENSGCFLVVLVSCLCLLQAPFSLKDMYMRYHQQVAYHDRQGRMVKYRWFFYDERCRALDGALDWLNSKAHPSDIVAVSMPHWVYLRTGLKAVMPPFEPEPAKVDALLDSASVNYAVLDGTLYGKPADTTQYVAPAVRNASDRWERVYFGEQGGCEIYRRVAPVKKQDLALQL